MQAEIISIEENERNSIIVWLCFTLDDQELVYLANGKPQIRNDRNVWPLYSGIQNYLSKTPQERLEWIKINTENQIGNIIIDKARKTLNPDLMTDLRSFAGTMIEKTWVEIEVDINHTDEKRTIKLYDTGIWELAIKEL